MRFRYLLLAVLSLTILTAQAEPLSHFQTFVDTNDENSYVGFTANSVTTSDGKFVYTISSTEHAINTFRREPDQKLNLIDSQVGDKDTGEGIRSPNDILISPDDRHIYVIALKPDNVDPTIYVYERDLNTGLVTEVQAYRERGLSTPSQMLMSDDGLFIYVSSINSHSVTVLARAANGQLTERQFINEVSQGLGAGYDYTDALALSPDQNHLYVGTGAATSTIDCAIVHFKRDQTNGTLQYIDQVDHTQTDTTDLERPSGMVVSPDGKHLYAVGSFDSVFGFDIDANGSLSISGRFGVDPSDADIIGIYVLNNIKISNNGHLLYSTDTVTDSLLVFHREIETGDLSYLGAEVHGKDGVVELRQNDRVYLSLDNHYAYVGSAFGFTAFDISTDVALSSTYETVDGQTSLTISVANQGSASAHHIRYMAELDSSIVLLSADAFRPETLCEINQQIVSCEMDRLVAGEVEEITLQWAAVSANPVTVESSVTQDEVDNETGNNTLTDSVDANNPGRSVNDDTPSEPEPAPEPEVNAPDPVATESGGGGSMDILFLITLVISGLAFRQRQG